MMCGCARSGIYRGLWPDWHETGTIALGGLGQSSSIAYRSQPACFSALFAIAANFPH
ncbi:hypothetical protein NSND_60290 [Nitrospira sp. ND1]|nr:hypothetical protein NSND_60290 [Nitrospira sp. ND1]